MSTQGWSLVRGPSPFGSEQGQPQLSEIWSGRFSSTFPDCGTLDQSLHLSELVSSHVYLSGLLDQFTRITYCQVPSYSKCSVREYMLLQQCERKENSGPDFSQCWLVCLLPASLYLSLHSPLTLSLFPFLPPSVSLSFHSFLPPSPSPSFPLISFFFISFFSIIPARV